MNTVLIGFNSHVAIESGFSCGQSNTYECESHLRAVYLSYCRLHQVQLTRRYSDLRTNIAQPCSLPVTFI